MERTVLIIEDEKLIIVSTQMVLEAAGFRVADTPLEVRHQVEIARQLSIPEMAQIDAEAAQRGDQEHLDEPWTDENRWTLVARGLSDSPADALLQAVHAWLKEQ